VEVSLVEFYCTVISFVIKVHFIMLSKHAYATAFMLPFVYNCTFLSQKFLLEVCFECEDIMPFKIRDTATFAILYRIEENCKWVCFSGWCTNRAIWGAPWHIRDQQTDPKLANLVVISN